MSKKLVYKMAASLVCLAFLVSLTPALSGAQQTPVKSLKQLSFLSSFRMLSYLFPLLSTFTDLSQDDNKVVEKVNADKALNLTPKSTDEATSIGPKTKD